MNANDFYGTPVAVSPKAASIEMPQTARNTSTKPAMFWGVMVALLIGVRVLYEMAGK